MLKLVILIITTIEVVREVIFFSKFPAISWKVSLINWRSVIKKRFFNISKNYIKLIYFRESEIVYDK